MFSVIFDVEPRPAAWDAYLAEAEALRPELEGVDGFVDAVRYRSLTRDGWILSLSTWRDEKSVVRWRTRERHHDAQLRARSETLGDYRLRVGQVTRDTRLPPGCEVVEQRLDESEVGLGRAVTLIEAERDPGVTADMTPQGLAEWLGYNPYCAGCVDWDIFEAAADPDLLVMVIAWRDASAGQTFGDQVDLRPGARMRHLRIIRDYAKYDRREAPQYFPDVTGAETIRG